MGFERVHIVKTPKREELEEIKDNLKAFLNENKVKVVDSDKDADIIISIGGDGTVMWHLKEYLDRQIPVLGISGHKSFGFYNATDRYKFKTDLDGLISGKDYYLNKLTVLKGFLNEVFIGYAINDISLERPDSEGIVTYSVGNEVFYGNGVLAATFQGSTGYYRSANGVPFEKEDIIGIAHINLSKYSHISDHHISGREKAIPICFERQGEKNFFSEKQVAITSLSERAALLIDGKLVKILSKDDVIRIEKSDKKANLISLKKLRDLQKNFL